LTARAKPLGSRPAASFADDAVATEGSSSRSVGATVRSVSTAIDIGAQSASSRQLRGRERFFRQTLTRWGAANRRAFPWRETRDPYAVLVAELLLQKTPWYKVTRVYGGLLDRYPSPRELASADVSEVRALIAPLGLPKRAATLVALGRTLERDHGGQVPTSTKELQLLPGVGRYTAHAVECFAFGRTKPLIDEVAARLYRRFFGLPDQRRAYQDEALWSFAGELMPRRKSRDFAFAILDFASTVCTLRAPKCATCPLRRRCAFYLNLCESESAGNDG
jgi:A/G-specific adenine glycosylase